MSLWRLVWRCGLGGVGYCMGVWCCQQCFTWRMVCKFYGLHGWRTRAFRGTVSGHFQIACVEGQSCWEHSLCLPFWVCMFYSENHLWPFRIYQVVIEQFTSLPSYTKVELTQFINIWVSLSWSYPKYAHYRESKPSSNEKAWSYPILMLHRSSGRLAVQHLSSIHLGLCSPYRAKDKTWITQNKILKAWPHALYCDAILCHLPWTT
jgi:hypothetical protein